MPLDQVFANTMFVKDISVSRDFYSRVFEKDPVFQDENSVVFQFGSLLINLLAESEAPGLIGPALVATSEGGSRNQLTIQVQDVDAEAARLQELAVALVNGPMDRPWGIRTLLFADPDGHLWEFAQ